MIVEIAERPSLPWVLLVGIPKLSFDSVAYFSDVIWAYLGLPGPIWVRLGLSAPICAPMCAYLDLSEPIWSYLRLSVAM